MAEILRQVLRQFLCNAPDAQLLNATCVVEHNTDYDVYRGNYRGLWEVSLAQANDEAVIQRVTQPVLIRNPGRQPFALGSPSKRLNYGRPVYLEIYYSAPDGSDPLFWATAENVLCSLHLT